MFANYLTARPRLWMNRDFPARVILMGLAKAVFAGVVFAQPLALQLPVGDRSPAGAAERLRSLADERRHLFERSGFDRLVRELTQASQKLDNLDAAINDIKKKLVPAARKADHLAQAAQGVAGAGMAAVAAEAQVIVDQIVEKGRAVARERDQFQQQVTAPLIEKMAVVDRHWTRLYEDMREQMPRDREDPQAEPIADALINLTVLDASFVEGFVLGAIAICYTNRPPEDSMRLLDQAYTKRDMFLLPKSLLAVDFCYACCLANRPERADGIVKEMKKIADPHKSLEQDWIIGIHGFHSKKLNDAGKYLQSAAVEMKQQLNKKGITPNPVILADTVVLFMSGPSQQGRGQKLFAMDDSVRESGAWQSLRAQAMILAEDERFQEAAGLMEACVARAPDALRTELVEQLNNYAAKHVWRIK